MKKVLFTTLSIIAAAAMVLVSCKKEPTEKPDDNKDNGGQTEEYAGPVTGESDWSIIGSLTADAKVNMNWDNDIVMAENNGIFVVKNLKLEAADEFKIREKKGWDNNRGGAFEKLGEGFAVTNGGANIKVGAAGIYDVYYNPAVEQMAVCEKDGAPVWGEPEPDPVEVATWAAAEEAEAINFFQYWTTGDWGNPTVPPTEADSFDNVSFANGVYTYNITNGAPELWMAQLFLRPNPKKAYLPLAAGKFYRVSITIESSAAMTPFVKFTQYDPKENEDHNSEAYKKHEGGCFVEWGDVKLEADAPHTFTTVIKVADGMACNNVNWTLGLGGHAGATIKISNIIVEETEEPAQVLSLTEAILPEAAYPTINTVISAPTGEEFYVNNVATFPAYGGKFQMKKNGSFFANRTSFGKILSIKVTCQSDKSWYPTNLTVYAGAAEIPGETVIEGTSDATAKTGTYDFSSGDYQYFTIKNTSGYAVYLQEIEITYKGGVKTPAFALDGAFDEWTNIGAFTTTNDRITSWKAASDANNIYIYAVCPASVVTSRGIWNAYIDGAFDLDNNEETGGAASYSLGNGMEAAFVAFPFSNAAGEAPAFVNGEKSDSWIKYPVDTAVGKVTSFGKVDGDNTLVELAIPRNLIGNPASGATIAINIGMGTSPVGKQTLKLK